ncbi:hypothetical protein LTR56_018334 [Elasticomyces elasticus]|nr:hypothetical protein LTR22_022204 [Elasticomyces elasticus]KAK3628978.1 hypothetical protein LTR56_018334 [Elasticomyces elasticus]KAK4909215.1 hypothetical protein LTR49_021966 [Elasticomyces elasticus]KAK5743885.1 hypothetical protein LTS12_023686 [Elasticomyces elasticus]
MGPTQPSPSPQASDSDSTSSPQTWRTSATKLQTALQKFETTLSSHESTSLNLRTRFSARDATLPLHVTEAEFAKFAQNVEEVVAELGILNSQFLGGVKRFANQGTHCPICLASYEKDTYGGKVVKAVPCGHLFHGGCLEYYLESQEECVECLKVITEVVEVELEVEVVEEVARPILWPTQGTGEVSERRTGGHGDLRV